MSPGRYRTITAVALGLLIAIVITGSAVRLTGSGLGCDDWPNCNDERLVDVSSAHAAMEDTSQSAFVARRPSASYGTEPIEGGPGLASA